jgi:hypothetical protein
MNQIAQNVDDFFFPPVTISKMDGIWNLGHQGATMQFMPTHTIRDWCEESPSVDASASATSARARPGGSDRDELPVGHPSLSNLDGVAGVGKAGGVVAVGVPQVAKHGVDPTK